MSTISRLVPALGWGLFCISIWYLLDKYLLDNHYGFNYYVAVTIAYVMGWMAGTSPARKQ